MANPAILKRAFVLLCATLALLTSGRAQGDAAIYYPQAFKSLEPASSPCGEETGTCAILKKISAENASDRTLVGFTTGTSPANKCEKELSAIPRDELHRAANLGYDPAKKYCNYHKPGEASHVYVSTPVQFAAGQSIAKDAALLSLKGVASADYLRFKGKSSLTPAHCEGAGQFKEFTDLCKQVQACPLDANSEAAAKTAEEIATTQLYAWIADREMTFEISLAAGASNIIRGITGYTPPGDSVQKGDPTAVTRDQIVNSIPRLLARVGFNFPGDVNQPEAYLKALQRSPRVDEAADLLKGLVGSDSENQVKHRESNPMIAKNSIFNQTLLDTFSKKPAVSGDNLTKQLSKEAKARLYLEKAVGENGEFDLELKADALTALDKQMDSTQGALLAGMDKLKKSGNCMQGGASNCEIGEIAQTITAVESPLTAGAEEPGSVAQNSKSEQKWSPAFIAAGKCLWGQSASLKGSADMAWDLGRDLFITAVISGFTFGSGTEAAAARMLTVLGKNAVTLKRAQNLAKGVRSVTSAATLVESGVALNDQIGSISEKCADKVNKLRGSSAGGAAALCPSQSAQLSLQVAEAQNCTMDVMSLGISAAGVGTQVSVIGRKLAQRVLKTSGTQLARANPEQELAQLRQRMSAYPEARANSHLKDGPRAEALNSILGDATDPEKTAKLIKEVHGASGFADVYEGSFDELSKKTDMAMDILDPKKQLSEKASAELRRKVSLSVKKGLLGNPSNKVDMLAAAEAKGLKLTADELIALSGRVEEKVATRFSAIKTRKGYIPPRRGTQPGDFEYDQWAREAERAAIGDDFNAEHDKFWKTVNDEKTNWRAHHLEEELEKLSAKAAPVSVAPANPVAAGPSTSSPPVPSVTEVTPPKIAAQPAAPKVAAQPAAPKVVAQPTTPKVTSPQPHSVSASEVKEASAEIRRRVGKDGSLEKSITRLEGDPVDVSPDLTKGNAVVKRWANEVGDRAEVLTSYVKNLRLVQGQAVELVLDGTPAQKAGALQYLRMMKENFDKFKPELKAFMSGEGKLSNSILLGNHGVSITPSIATDRWAESLKEIEAGFIHLETH